MVRLIATDRPDALLKGTLTAMQCPYCGSDDLKVLDTTDTKDRIRRRRYCNACSERFTTHERVQTVTPVLIKSDGTRQEFDREKLKRGIWNACAKRPIPASEVERLVNRIEDDVRALGRVEISSRVVGDMVINGLKALDSIAYIRYAIVYHGLDNLESVRAEIDNLIAQGQSQSVQPFDPGTIAEADRKPKQGRRKPRKRSTARQAPNLV